MMKTKLRGVEECGGDIPPILTLKGVSKALDFWWLGWTSAEMEWFVGFYTLDIPTLTRLLTGWWVTDSTARIGTIETIPPSHTWPEDWPISLVELCKQSEPNVQLALLNMFQRTGGPAGIALPDCTKNAPERIGRIIMESARVLAGEATC